MGRIEAMCNKKVSYCNQIVRQDSSHQKLWPGQGLGRSCKIFFSSSLITVQNLVVVSYTVRANVGGPIILGMLGSRTLG